MKYLLLICTLTLSYSLKAQQFVSGVKQVPLIELYTSEGCSSCPPADRWLSNLKNNDSLWQTFVPVAFHVDYWDYIGWEDRFANPAYTQRQRRYAAEQGENVIYTPGMRKAGEEWRSWRFWGKPELPEADNVGKLSFDINRNSFTATFVPHKLTPAKQPMQLTVALLGMGLNTEVQRGENKGKQLQHDFVVLQLNTFAGQRVQNQFLWQGELLKNTLTNTQAIAVWVTKGASLTPIQAVGGFIKPL